MLFCGCIYLYNNLHGSDKNDSWPFTVANQYYIYSSMLVGYKFIVLPSHYFCW